jgi:hypothetical protein
VQPGTVFADRFVVEALAGEGGMGRVYRAFDRERGERVALKLLAEEAPEHAARFAQEARILAGLAHPGVVRSIAHGEAEGGQRWLALEWLEGEDLGKRLARGVLTVEETLAIGLAASEALAAAHARGVIHRDIKPSNLFLVGGDPRKLKLLDFGIARRSSVTRAITRSGIVMGTPGYVAPEQVHGDPADARADVFGLGAVLFECLAGRPAFAGGSVMAVLTRILVFHPPPLRRLRGDVPPELDALIAVLLAKDRGARPADGGAAAEALRGLDPQSLAWKLSDPWGSESIGAGEQRVITVLVAALEGTASPPPEQPTNRTEVLWIVRVESALAGLDVHAEAVAGGLLIVRSKDEGSPDQALLAAQAALTLRPLLEKDGAERPRIAIVTGPSEVGARWPAAELLDRAASLLSAPAPAAGAACVDDVTRALLAARFDLQRGPSGWELRGEREDAGSAQPVFEPSSPFVGREREIDALQALFEACTGEGVARAVLVSGPAGIGKSRLRREALLRFGALVPDAPIWTARARIGGEAAPFALLGSILRGAGGRAPGDRASAFPSLAAATLESGPLIVVLEDLQWADEASVLAVDQALGQLGDRPLFVLALARPEVHERFPRMWADRGAQEIHLGGLGRRAAARLVHHALGDHADPAEVAAFVERAGGHPLHLEELLRAAADGPGRPRSG